VILSEYERRLKDMENDHSQNSLKLRQIIENLMKEKDELNQRLIRANHEKLPLIEGTRDTTSGRTGFAPGNSGDDSSGVSDDEMSFYLWNIGII
jgi:hypothetical protein